MPHMCATLPPVGVALFFIQVQSLQWVKEYCELRRNIEGETDGECKTHGDFSECFNG
jgi:hypothetical protein